jgi:ATP-dependent Lon protease
MSDVTPISAALNPNVPSVVPAAPVQPEQNLKIDPLIQQELTELEQKVAGSTMPGELKFKIERMMRHLYRAAQSQQYAEEFERASKYIDWASRVPWESKSVDQLDLNRAKQILETHHYGMQEMKDRILEYMAILQLQLKSQQAGEKSEVRAPILLLVGLVGTGKTTFAYSIAEALDREIIRIPFGGMGSARDLRGMSRLHLDAEPGAVVKGLVNAKSRNPVILLDEIDRVAQDANRDIMGVLVELLDPAQNHAFTDHYLDFPVNLSEALFIATANNTRDIATAVYDRMEHLSMPSYTDEEKTVIAQKYVMPKMLKEAGMTADALVLADDIWRDLVRPLGFDAGIRTLERTLKGAVSKAARLMIEQNLNKVVITKENVKYFLPAY